MFVSFAPHPPSRAHYDPAADKFHATMHDVAVAGDPQQRRRVVLVKGAWDRLIARCATQAATDDAWGASEPIDREAWLAHASEYAKQGLRVLALAQMAVPDGTTAISVGDILGGEPRMQMNCLVAIVGEEGVTCVGRVWNASVLLPSRV